MRYSDQKFLDEIQRRAVRFFWEKTEPAPVDRLAATNLFRLES